MILTDKILSGLIVAFIIWLITSVTSFFIKKHRLEKAIIVDINYHILGVKEAREFINILFDRVVKVDGKILRKFHFREDDYWFYKSIQNLLFTYLTHTKIERLIKFYSTLLEAEHILIGLVMDLNEIKLNDEIIDQEKFDFLKAKKERASSILELLDIGNIKSIDDLPNDYRNRKGPEHML